MLTTIKNRLSKHLFTRVRQTGRASDNRGVRGRCCDDTQQSRHNKTTSLFFSQMESVVSDPQIVPLLPTGGRTHHRSEEDSGKKKGKRNRENQQSQVIWVNSMQILWWFCILFKSRKQNFHVWDFGQTILVLQKTKQYFES